MTYIELFDHAAVENICACLVRLPQQVILLCDDYDRTKPLADGYEALFAKRGLTVRFHCREVNRNKLSSIVDSLSYIVERNEDCVIGLTGGEDLYLVAVGIVYERYKDKGLKIHRFNLGNGTVIDCDQDGVTVAQDRQPKLTVEENVRLYGGDVLFGEGAKTNLTFRWDMNEEFREDIRQMWKICAQKGNREWNAQMKVLEKTSKEDPGGGLYLQAARSAVEAGLCADGDDMVINKGILGALQDAGLLKSTITDTAVKFEFKNEQVKRCLTKAGQVLEMLIYLAALEASSDDGQRVYNHALTGVHIDWDGKLGKNDGKYDTKNEVDVIIMHGVVPVFVSCKNGFVEIEELYKLHTVAERFGSRHAKKVLVAPALSTYGTQYEYVRTRAEDMGIRLITKLPADDHGEINRVIRSLWRN